MAMRSRSALSRRGKVINKPYLYIGLVLLVTFTLAPFAWLISSSFQTGSELLSIPPHAIPREPTLDNFARLFATEKTVTGFQSSDYAKSVWNSVIVASATTLISLALVHLRAFARLRYPLRLSCSSFSADHAAHGEYHNSLFVTGRNLAC